MTNRLVSDGRPKLIGSQFVPPSLVRKKPPVEVAANMTSGLASSAASDRTCGGFKPMLAVAQDEPPSKERSTPSP